MLIFVIMEGDSPLFVTETVAMVRKLLDYGANPFVTNFEGKTV